MPILWEVLRSGVVQTAVLLSICIAIEQVAVLERFALRQRWRGLVFAFVGLFGSILLSWMLQQFWGFIGIAGTVVVPVYDWLGPWVYYPLTILLADLLAYWRHRAEHRWFWPIHAVHHCPRELHAANSWGHPLQVIPDLLFVTFPLSFVQMPGPEAPLAIGLVVAFLALYIHSPTDIHFGPFRRVVVDNRFHRIHHSVEPQHVDHNFGICFSLWDWLFRTAYWPEKGEWPRVGIDHAPPETMRQFLAYPLRVASSYRDGRPADCPSAPTCAPDSPRPSDDRQC